MFKKVPVNECRPFNFNETMKENVKKFKVHKIKNMVLRNIALTFSLFLFRTTNMKG